jgi:hypothetical protein
MNHSRWRWALVLAALTACKDGESSGDGDEATCIGAKCDDLDAVEPPAGALDLPPPRADLGVDPSTTCAASCAVFTSCLGAAEGDCLLECDGLQADAAAHSAEGASAADDLLVCIARLDCEAAAAYQAGSEGYPCEAEDLAVASACAANEPVPSACAGFCTLASSCTESEVEACNAACSEAQAGADAVGPTCGAAQTAVCECVAALPDCAAFDAWTAAAGDHPCADADAMVAVECNAAEEG